MVFKRKKPLTYYQAATQFLYPKGGWRRAAQYIAYRIRRLPDPAHKIARGIGVGVFVCFTPFFGLHFLFAAVISWVIGGNIMASLLATFFGNPFTFPLIAAVSMEVGTWIMGQPSVPLPFVLTSFSDAALELWRNTLALFGSGEAEWDRLALFGDRIFLPYLVGGFLPGLGCGIAAYILTEPVVSTYQKARVARMKRKFARKRELAEARRQSQTMGVQTSVVRKKVERQAAE